jgi:hypothetical protein
LVGFSCVQISDAIWLHTHGPVLLKSHFLFYFHLITQTTHQSLTWHCII